MVCITKTLQSRNVAFIILTGGRVFSYESDFCGELCFDRRPPTLSDPQQWELQTDLDANKVIITKSGRRVGPA